ncbi:hypothetical protein AEM38_13330 [Hyphomonadaceae bacterium UKL13-1]|nr:hypothetical protein AEM38_13330 [Hyphomonadaceae bacterium UKL13-1]
MAAWLNVLAQVSAIGGGGGGWGRGGANVAPSGTVVASAAGDAGSTAAGIGIRNSASCAGDATPV